jgi:transcriptional regulator of NAD metabolism
MADNLTFTTTVATAPSGSVIATDDVASVHYQVVKLGLGADGALDNLVDSGQQLSSASIPVVISSDQSAVTVDGSAVTQPISGTITANLSATDNAVLDTIDAVLDTINAKLVTGTVIGDVNLGVTDNAVLDSIDTATTATQTAVEIIDNAVYVDDADWTDSASSHILTGGIYQSTPQTITDGDTGPLEVTTNGYLITSVNGTVTVDGSGVTQPVSGTVTANLSATDNAVLDTIDAVLDTINAKLVTGTVIGDVNLGATDNAVLDAISTATTATQAAVEGTLTVAAHAVTNAGTFAVQIVDTSFAVADGNALGEGVLIQGDDGTDRKNINVDATTGDVQVDVTNTVTVDGSGVTQPVSGTVTANLSATDNAVLDTIDAVLDTINAKLVTGTVIGDVNLGATDNAVLDSIDTATTAIQAAVEIIDNAISGSEMQVDIVSGSSSGTEYTEDAIAVANPVGTQPVMVRQDTPAGLTTADGDVVGQRATDYGAAFVQVLDSSGNFIDSFSGSGGTSHADDATFTVGSASSVTPVAYLADETTPDSVDEGDVGVPRMTLTRKPYAVITDPASENNAAVDGSGHLQVDVAASSATVTVDGSGVTQPVSGTVTANLSATDNAVLDTIDAVLDTINAKLVTGTVIGDVNLGATDNAVLDSIQAAVEIIDNAVYVDDADWTDSTSSHLLVGGVYQSAPQTITDGDVGPLQVTTNGYVITSINGTVTVDGSAVTQPVSGTVTANLSATDNAVLDTIDAVLDTINAKLVTGTVIGDVNLGATDNAVLDTIVTNTGNSATSLAIIDDWDNAASDGASVSGDVAHDTADAGEPVKVGHKAIAHGTNPTDVAANDRTDWYSNRAGIPWVIGGHPNKVTIRANYTGAQTNAAIVTVAASNKIVVTRCSVMADNANSVDVQARIGFATATTPTTTGVVLSHPGIAAGSGVVEGSGAGMLGVGADNEDLRITSEVPTSGSIDVVVSYYTIGS